MISGKGRERIFSFEVKYFAFLKNIDTFFFFFGWITFCYCWIVCEQLQCHWFATGHETHSEKLSVEKNCYHKKDVWKKAVWKMPGNKCQTFFQTLTNCFGDNFEKLEAKIQIDFATIYVL